MRRAAIFDPTGAYRYSLTREWEGSGEGRLCFIMLNPSTADADRDDPTIRRCIGFARAWGLAAVEVVNLFAYRTPSPAQLCRAPEPIGSENDAHIARAVNLATVVVAAWGGHGSFQNRGRAVRPLLGVAPVCLGLTQTGEPRHPLYLRLDTRTQPLCA